MACAGFIFAKAFWSQTLCGGIQLVFFFIVYIIVTAGYVVTFPSAKFICGLAGSGESVSEINVSECFEAFTEFNKEPLTLSLHLVWLTSAPLVLWIISTLVTLYIYRKSVKYDTGHETDCCPYSLHLDLSYLFFLAARIFCFFTFTICYALLLYKKNWKVDSRYDCPVNIKNNSITCKYESAGDREKFCMFGFIICLLFCCSALTELFCCVYWKITRPTKEVENGGNRPQGGTKKKRCRRCSEFAKLINISLEEESNLGGPVDSSRIPEEISEEVEGEPADNDSAPLITAPCNGGAENDEERQPQVPSHQNNESRQNNSLIVDASGGSLDPSLSNESYSALQRAPTGISSEDPFSIKHRESLRTKLRVWKVEVISSNPYSDSLFKEMDARDRGKYFGELQIVETTTMNKFLAEESPLSIDSRIKYFARRIQTGKMFDKNTKKLFIRGIAGIGKTSLTQYFGYMWAIGVFFRNLFDYVLLIECRELKEKVEGKSPTQYLTEFVMNKCCIERLPTNGDKVLIIIDGLDEYHNLDEAVREKNGTLGCLLSRDSDFLKGHATLLTGRPHVEHHFLNDEDLGNYTHFEITGLDVTQVDKLIDLIADDSGIAMEIKKKIHSSPYMEKLSLIPRYLELICFVISDIIKDRNEIINMNTLTPLFTWMFTMLWIKHIEKGRRKTRGYYEIFQDPAVSSFLKSLCKCAYELYIGNKIIFSKKLFFECFGQDQLSDESINKMIEAFIIKREKEGDDLYQFRHLTTMEFFAAAHCFTNQIPVEELIKKKYIQVIRFVAGFHGGASAKETDKDRRIVKLFVQCVEGKSNKDQEQIAELKREEWFLDLKDHCRILGEVQFNFLVCISFLSEGYSFKTLHLLKHDRNSIHIESSEDMINFNKFMEELTERNFISSLNSIELKCYILPSSETADVNFLRSLPDFKSVYFSTMRNISNEFCQKLLETFQENTIYTRSIFLSECDLETSESSGVIAELATLIPEVHLWGVNYHCKILDEILRRAKRGSDTKLRELFVDTDKEGKEWKDFIAAISESPIKIKLYGKFHFKNY